MKFSVEENAWQCTAHTSQSCFFLSFPINLSTPPSISGTHVSVRASLLLCLPLGFWQTYQHSTNTTSHTHAVLCKLNLHPNSTVRLVCVCVATWYDRLECWKSRLKRLLVSKRQIAHASTFHRLNIICLHNSPALMDIWGETRWMWF